MFAEHLATLRDGVDRLLERRAPADDPSSSVAIAPANPAPSTGAWSALVDALDQVADQIVATQIPAASRVARPLSARHWAMRVRPAEGAGAAPGAVPHRHTRSLLTAVFDLGAGDGPPGDRTPEQGLTFHDPGGFSGYVRPATHLMESAPLALHVFPSFLRCEVVPHGGVERRLIVAEWITPRH